MPGNAGGVEVSQRSSAGFFSSSRTFFLPRGRHVAASTEVPRGYFIDFTVKASQPLWPAAWQDNPAAQLHVWLIQHGLGAYERFLSGDGEEWRESMLQTAWFLVRDQQSMGAQRGGFIHHTAFPHSYRLSPPWLSGMAQGQAASLLVRAYGETTEERFARAAVDALRPMSVPVASGGVLAELDARPFVEEYPTLPGSFVLNGALFAVWGVLEVEAVLGAHEGHPADDLVGALAASLHRWDTGYWSRYDLYPHPIVNVASSFYNLLHIHQLEEFDRRYRDRGFLAMANQLRNYEDRRSARRRALLQKAAFRVLVPRNRWLARHVPWGALGRV